MKVVVYAIAKNEEQFVKRWVNSMKEADEIYVLDTGSTDNTVKILKQLGVHVSVKKISPWRFDFARNESLKLIPPDTDICVCTDLDEVFDKGWRDLLEKSWTKNTTRLKYNYNWSFKENNTPATTFYLDKIHILNGYKWIHPVHEVLQYNFEEIITCNEEIVLNHYPDVNKSRSQYLNLLELSVLEDPTDDRNMHYLGREYLYYQEYNKCIDTLIKHLNLPSATWKLERCASMRYIGRSYLELKRYDEAIMWYDKAIQEAPHTREPYVEYAILKQVLNKHDEAIDLIKQALEIKNKNKEYINEEFAWDETIYDLLSVSYFSLKQYSESLKNIDLAIKINPHNNRLKDNQKIIMEKQV